jgi:hypothetical protein
MSDSNKNLVMGSRWGPNTKTDWLTDHRLQNNLNLNLINLYTADLTILPESNTATFANDTAVVAMAREPAIASQKLQIDLLAIQNWFKKWRMKANKSMSIHVTFTTRRETCPPVSVF